MRPDRTAWLVLGGALAFYVATLAPSLNWGDGGRVQLDVALGGSNYWFLPELVDSPLDGGPFARLGVAPWDHPLYVLLGRVALAVPLGDPLWKLNFLSAIAAAAVVALVYSLGRRLGIARAGAVLGALALAVSHTLWYHAVTTEVYALHMLFMLALIALAWRWQAARRPADLSLWALCAGLGLANHLMLGLTIVCVVAFMIAGEWRQPRDARVPLGRIVMAAGWFLAGFAPWWVQFLRVVRVIGLPLAIEGVFWFPSGPRPMAAPTWLDLAPNLLPYLGFLVYQFTPLGVALGVVGFAHLLRTRRAAAALLGLVYLAHLGLALGIPISDRFQFYLPSHVIFAVWIGAGAHLLLERATDSWPRRRVAVATALALFMATPPAVYAATPRLLRAWGIAAPDLGIPTVTARDGLRYFLNPAKRGDDSALRFAVATLGAVAPNAVILAAEPNLEVGIALRYWQHAAGARPDVYVDPIALVPRATLAQEFLTRVRALSPCRPVYLADLPADSAVQAELRTGFDVVAEANLHRVIPRQPVAPAHCPVPYERLSLSSVVRMALR